MEIYTQNLDLKDPSIKKGKQPVAGKKSGQTKPNTVLSETQKENFRLKNDYLTAFKSITKSQILINNYHQIKDWLQDNTQRPETVLQDLNALVDKTGYNGEKILEPYRMELTQFVKDRNISGLNDRIRSIEADISLLVDRLPDNYKDVEQTIIQNRTAIRRESDESAAYKMMADVIDGLKNRDDIGLNIKRDKIIDLLD